MADPWSLIFVSPSSEKCFNSWYLCTCIDLLLEYWCLTWFTVAQLWHCVGVFWVYLWGWKRIWAFPLGNMWSLYWYWCKDGLQDEDMFNLWWQGSSYENWSNSVWLVFAGSCTLFSSWAFWILNHLIWLYNVEFWNWR